MASTFDTEAILAALLQDSIKWEKGCYEPEKIAMFWRSKLDRKSIAKNIENLATRVLNNTLI